MVSLDTSSVGMSIYLILKYKIMHVPGVTNKVVDCLSRYYENDRYDEIHESHHYVSADVQFRSKLWGSNRSPPSGILELKPSALLLARRLQDCNEDRGSWGLSEWLYPTTPGMQEQRLGWGYDCWRSPPKWSSAGQKVLGDGLFLEAIKSGYQNDPMLSKIARKPWTLLEL